MKATVILTSYNRPILLYRAINSVFNQDYTDEIELIVCDDNSPNPQVQNSISNAQQVLQFKQFTGKRTLIDLQSYKNRRRMVTDYSRNINNALLASSGDVIFYLTDDDEFLPNHVRLLIEYLQNNTHAHIVFGQQLVEHLNDITLETTHAGIRYHAGNLTQAACMIDHNQFAHRWGVIEKVGFWPEHKLHYGACDASFFTECANAGYMFYNATLQTTSKHRLHYNSVQGKMLNNEEPDYD
jgi:spore maturation protein CgeD